MDRLGLKQHQFAKLIAVTPRTVSLWVTGETQVPGPVLAYLRVVEKLSIEARESEFSRIEGKSAMLEDGLYKVDYHGELSFGSAMMVLKNGKLFGADVGGAIYEGAYGYDAASESTHFGISLKLPPNTELVTGLNAGPLGSTLAIVASFKRPSPVAKSNVSVAGRNVEAELTFVGPIPS